MVALRLDNPAGTQSLAQVSPPNIFSFRRALKGDMLNMLFAFRRISIIYDVSAVESTKICVILHTWRQRKNAAM